MLIFSRGKTSLTGGQCYWPVAQLTEIFERFQLQATGQSPLTQVLLQAAKPHSRVAYKKHKNKTDISQISCLSFRYGRIINVTQARDWLHWASTDNGTKQDRTRLVCPERINTPDEIYRLREELKELKQITDPGASDYRRLFGRINALIEASGEIRRARTPSLDDGQKG